MKKAGTYFAVLSRQLNLYLNHELSGDEITASELLYLFQLYDQDGLTQEQMSEEVSVDKAATTRTLQALEKKGMIRRVASKEDRRAKKVFLTQKAKTYEWKLRKLQAQWLSGISQDMSNDEVRDFMGHLEKMVQRAREMNGEE